MRFRNRGGFSSGIREAERRVRERRAAAVVGAAAASCRLLRNHEKVESLRLPEGKGSPELAAALRRWARLTLELGERIEREVPDAASILRPPSEAGG